MSVRVWGAWENWEPMGAKCGRTIFKEQRGGLEYPIVWNSDMSVQKRCSEILKNRCRWKKLKCTESKYTLLSLPFVPSFGQYPSQFSSTYEIPRGAYEGYTRMNSLLGLIIPCRGSSLAIGSIWFNKRDCKEHYSFREYLSERSLHVTWNGHVQPIILNLTSLSLSIGNISMSAWIKSQPSLPWQPFHKHKPVRMYWSTTLPSAGLSNPDNGHEPHTSAWSNLRAIIAFPPLPKHSPTTLSIAEFLDSYIRFVNVLSSPPTIDFNPLPIAEPQLRERTVMPKMVPRTSTTRYPGSSFMVVVITPLVSTKHAGVPSLTVFRALWAAADASAAVDDVAILKSEIVNYVWKTFFNSSIEC